MENTEFDKVIAVNVDVQNDFCPGGSLAVTEGNLVVPPLNKVNDWVRANNGNVIFTADWHPRQTAHFAEFGGPWPPHCVRYTTGAAFNKDLLIAADDNIALKGTGKVDDGYSGWYARLTDDSPLYRAEQLLVGGGGWTDGGITAVGEAVLNETARNNRAAVVVGGLATDYCVKATVLDALEARTKAEITPEKLGIFVLRDAIRAVNIEPGDGGKALAEMEAAGAIVLTSAEVVNGALQVA